MATLSGTMTRSLPASAGLQVSLQQKVGRTTIISQSTFVSLSCDSGETRWTATLSGAAFGSGNAVATVTAFATDPLTGGFVQSGPTSTNVHLKGGP